MISGAMTPSQWWGIGYSARENPAPVQGHGHSLTLDLQPGLGFTPSVGAQPGARQWEKAEVKRYHMEGMLCSV